MFFRGILADVAVFKADVRICAVESRYVVPPFLSESLIKSTHSYNFAHYNTRNRTHRSDFSSFFSAHGRFRTSVPVAFVCRSYNGKGVFLVVVRVGFLVKPTPLGLVGADGCRAAILAHLSGKRTDV